MFGKKVLLKIGALACAGVLSACASNTSPDLGTTTVETKPPVADTGPIGPVPGSQADLSQTAGDTVFFGYNQYNLSTQAQAVLARQAAWLKAYPEARIRVAGNCDERGTREYNLALGARRANAARNYLTSQGIDAARVTTISYGKERPSSTGSNEAAWAQNRNAMSVLVGGTGS